MLNSLINILSCEVCGGTMVLDYDSSMDFYKKYLNILSNNNNVIEVVDSIMLDVISYKCISCGITSKHSFKDIERKARKKLFEKLLIYFGKDIIANASFTDNRYLIYCGKCSGFDGHGCCPKDLLNNCEIKRFPLCPII